MVPQVSRPLNTPGGTDSPEKPAQPNTPPESSGNRKPSNQSVHTYTQQDPESKIRMD